MDFNSMINSMAGVPAGVFNRRQVGGSRQGNRPNTVCRCRDGFLPLMSKTDNTLQVLSLTFV